MFNKMTIARPYGRAAYEIAKAEAMVQPWEEFLVSLVSFAKNPDVAGWVSSPFFDEAGFITFLRGTPNFGSVSESMWRFLEVLCAQQGRFSLLEQILSCFIEEKSLDTGIFEARVVSAYPMSESDLLEWKPLLVKKFGHELRFRFDVDPSLLAGFVVSVKDKTLDFSAEGRLASLRQALLS
jgi:F-type H+-transporting ATPase subunit delta